MRRILPSPALLLIPLAALMAVLPLVLRGCSCGHDFNFHLLSWMEAAAQFRSGTLHPTWAFSAAWNAGEPRFVFYPPISWMLGALLGMVLPWVAVPVVFTWICLTISGFTMYGLARELADDEASVTGPILAAVAYMLNPYMLFTAYERTAYAELLAAAWIPLMLLAVLRRRVTVTGVAIPVALLWSTNDPAAVMGCYALGLLAGVRLVWQWIASRAELGANPVRACLGLAGRFAAGVALGLGVAAFYIVPAAYERRWVQLTMTETPGFRIVDNLLFGHTSDEAHDAVLHTASIIAVFLLVAAVVAIFVEVLRLRRGRALDVLAAGRRWYLLASFATLTVFIVALLTPVGLIVWRTAPELAYVLFPWRFLSALAAIVCAGIGFALERWQPRRGMLTAVVACMVVGVTLPLQSRFWLACDEEDAVPARLAAFLAKTGSEQTDEYTPGTADNEALGQHNPPFWVATDGDAAAPPNAASTGTSPMHFTIDWAETSMVILNLRDYPAWRVRVNGAEVAQRTERADGLIAFPVAAGPSRIDISYAMTDDRRLGEGITFVALAGLLAIALTGRRGAGLGRRV